VSPAAWPSGVTNLTIVVAGIGLHDATGIVFLQGSAADPAISVSELTVNGDGTEATVVITISTSAAPGIRVIQIDTPTGASTVVPTGANDFTVQ
jgi:hypothetical protein